MNCRGGCSCRTESSPNLKHFENLVPCILQETALSLRFSCLLPHASIRHGSCREVTQGNASHEELIHQELRRPLPPPYFCQYKKSTGRTLSPATPKLQPKCLCLYVNINMRIFQMMLGCQVEHILKCFRGLT